jgi:N-acetyl-anhydromuramyl-L-alanine amidase AmpD
MKRLINAIVIHCSATPNGKDFGAKDIDAMHKVRGFKRDSQARRNFNPDLPHIGYHFVITTDGVLHTARGIEEIGAHVQGSNAKSIGVCMVGTDKFNLAQWEALSNCMLGLASRISGHPVQSAPSCVNTFKDMGISIVGHRDFSPDLDGDGIIERTEWIKICPGFSVKDWVRSGMVEFSGAIL